MLYVFKLRTKVKLTIKKKIKINYKQILWEQSLSISRVRLVISVYSSDAHIHFLTLTVAEHCISNNLES